MKPDLIITSKDIDGGFFKGAIVGKFSYDGNVTICEDVTRIVFPGQVEIGGNLWAKTKSASCIVNGFLYVRNNLMFPAYPPGQFQLTTNQIIVGGNVEGRGAIYCRHNGIVTVDGNVDFSGDIFGCAKISVQNDLCTTGTLKADIIVSRNGIIRATHCNAKNRIWTKKSLCCVSAQGENCIFAGGGIHAKTIICPRILTPFIKYV